MAQGAGAGHIAHAQRPLITIVSVPGTVCRIDRRSIDMLSPGTRRTRASRAVRDAR